MEQIVSLKITGGRQQSYTVNTLFLMCTFWYIPYLLYNAVNDLTLTWVLSCVICSYLLYLFVPCQGYEHCNLDFCKRFLMNHSLCRNWGSDHQADTNIWCLDWFLMKMETFIKDFHISIHFSFYIKICTIKSWKQTIIAFIIWVCWQKSLCVSSSLKTGPLHFWSDFWPGPAAERKRLEMIAEPCPFLHPAEGRKTTLVIRFSSMVSWSPLKCHFCTCWCLPGRVWDRRARWEHLQSSLC